MINVLWLASWYPNRMDAFDGDFIERHAKAVSQYAKISLLLVVKDESLKSNSVEIEKSVDQNLTVYKVYYGRSGWGGPLEHLLSLWKYSRLQKQLYQKILLEAGAPQLVHVQVAMKAGILARWLKKKHRIPYVVTEHWTGYFPKSEPNLYNSNWLFQQLNRKILNDAGMFLPVSNNLGKIVTQYFTAVPFLVVPNVVDTGIFYCRTDLPHKFRFIHPSSMGYQKNPEGILAACKILKESGYDFELLMVGNLDERLVSLSTLYGLNEMVVFEAAVPYPAIASLMRQSSALVLFSRFENLPCVILEAMCCGLPVISSRVGGIEEVIDDKNGILVESENVDQLATAMKTLMHSINNYDHFAISQRAIALYNYATVGFQYAAIYQSILEQV